ncbi:MAG TPA: hypothetical protein VL547_16875, partial [Dinghuibacter sp.]|uniref:hypothetical protein n=1 Tax=Dinghuibacter sp. TaxID=2024697 RepID=UPI002C6BC665
MTHELNFSTQFRQFYIADKGYLQDTGNEGFWTIDAVDAHLAVGKGILGVGIGCYGPFKGVLSILASKRNGIDYNRYDHVVEGGLDV